MAMTFITKVISMGFELELQIDEEHEDAKYFQIYRQIRDLITSGAIPGGSKLPSIRTLAKNTDVNTSTVVNAYKMLEKDNLVYKREGSGTFVLSKDDEVLIGNDTFYFEPGELEFGYSYGEDVIDLSSSAPDPNLFPIKDFKNVMDEVLEEDGASAFMYQTSTGYLPLRKSLQSYSGSYGIKCNEDDIYVVSGAQQGIDIIAKAMVKSGDYVFVETPTYCGAIAAFKSRGARLVQVSLYPDGPGIKELEMLVKQFRPILFYAMPNFHNPTGYTYSERKKRYLLLLARKYNFKVLEDDYAGDLNFSTSRIFPLKSFDNDNSVIYLKSFSKIFMPGLRLAYLIVPEEIRERTADAKIASDISTSGLMQRVLRKYIEEGILKRHTEYLKKELAVRYLEMVRAVRKCIRGGSLVEPRGGLNLWVKLPNGISSVELYDKCMEKKVVISPGIFYTKGEVGLTHMRISFSGVDIEKIWQGISIIGTEVENIKNKNRIEII